jgi:hypothetical protein
VGVGANTVRGWGTIDGKDAFFSFGKVAAEFQDPETAEIASWILEPVNKAPRTQSGERRDNGSESKNRQRPYRGVPKRR